MMILLMKLIMIFSLMTSIMKTPMAMGMILLMQTLAATLMLMKMMTNSWMSMIMFLMFIGGLLILFMYMSSIASNEKFNHNMKFYICLIIMFIPIEDMMLDSKPTENQDMNYHYQFMLTKMYSKKTMWLTIIMFIYMFITMIVVTTIIKIHKGPMRIK
nr:NADH dehydrogenase subunit 6 [Paradorydium reflexanum]